ncbi:MAG: lipocalin-like domain-containing protein [Candidatus Poribacteria bacterium]
MNLLICAVAAVLLGAAIALFVNPSGPPPAASATLSLRDVLNADGADGFARVEAPAALEFPRDHGPHPRHRVEWWYFTGNVESGAGRRFAYQLTFFRRARSAVQEASTSSWATNQMYMAHFALTDVEAERHVGFEKLSRGAAGLAGSAGAPFRVWVDDWSARTTGNALFPIRLQASDGAVEIGLHLTAEKPLVLHGEDGFSSKTRDALTASYYYSWTRLNTAGALSVGGTDYEVTGSSWMDHEWSTSVLDARHQGWDWFSVQLDDGTEFMCFRMRHVAGPAASFVTGTYVSADGESRSMSAAEIELSAGEPLSAVARGPGYPSSWRISLPHERLELRLTPLVADQEMDLSFRYWEGAVRARGSRAGEEVTGYGYVELTGYQAATTAP